MNRSLLVAAALLALTLSSPARADGDDEVTLKNGGSVRGTIVAVEPGSKVVILELGSREPRTLPWAEVADVEKGKFAKRAEPGALSAGYDADDAPDVAPHPGVVKVHIESDKPVQLIEEVSTSVGAVGGHVVLATHMRTVCAAPCDRVVDGSRGQHFFVVGDDMPPSDTFRLSDRSSDTTIRVDGGSNALRSGSVVLGSFAVIGLLGGIPLLTVGAAIDDRRTSETLVPVGAIATIGGGVLLAGSIAMAIAGGTDVEIVDAPAKTGQARSARWWLGEF